VSPALRFMLRGLAVLWAALLLAHVLAGCGGGGDPATDEPTPGVNCALQPVVCK